MPSNATVRWGALGRLAVIVSALTALAYWAPLARADDTLKLVDTQALRVLYYDPATASLVPRATRSLLAGLEAHRRIFDYTPTDRINVLLQDFSDLSNATTLASPHNRIFVDTAAQTEPYEYVSAGDPYAWLSAHELTHIVTLDRASPTDSLYRRWFHGKVAVDSTHPESMLYWYLTTPRDVSPNWYTEGSGVFAETWLMGGLGRAQGGYDEMIFRGMVKEGAHFYTPLGLASKGVDVDFRTGANAYLYGTRFMNYLALRYGPDHLVSWWRRDAASERYYSKDFQRVFGLPVERAWQDWVLWEREFQKKNLSAVQEHPITVGQDLTKSVLGSVSRNFLSADGSKLYAAVKFPGQLAHLVTIDRKSGAVTNLNEIKGAFGLKVTALAFDAASETAFYCTENAGFRNVEAYDVRSGKARTLLDGARIGDLAFNAADRSLWGIRYNNGFGMLVRVPYPYKDWKVVHVFPSDERAFDVDVSADGRWLSVSVSMPGKSVSAPITEVRVLNTAALEKEDATAYRTFNLEGAVTEGSAFSKDGRYLYASSYYTGVSNIFRYEIETQKVDAVTNAELGFFTPQPLDDTQLLVLRYSSTGFVPTLIDIKPTEDMSSVAFLGEQVSSKYPDLKTWTQAPANSVPFEPNVLHRGSYHALHEIALDSTIPVLEGYKQSVGAGVVAKFSDPMGFDTLLIDASYSPDSSLNAKERAHLAADFHHGRWTVGARWNGADFYDLFGPTKRSREGYSGYVDYDYPLVLEQTKSVNFIARAAYYGGLDALPTAQNVSAPATLSTIDVGLQGSDARSSPGSVDDEAGQTWSVVAHTYGAAGDIIPSLQVQYDIGLPLPLNHSSLWLRTGASVSEGHTYSALSNAYLGGFGNNYVDNAQNGGAQRYRQLLSMPGFEIDALNGRNLAKALIEWSLPPIRFEELGSPGFYATWARPEIFASVLETDLDNRGLRQSARNIGVQIDFQLHVMHRLPMMLSIGVAKGFGGAGMGKTEFMLSLQVL